jgi:methionyl-tRNA synthetase
MTKPIYVTTTIPYVNAPPHIGFALELVQADVIARYQRLKGRQVRLQSGTDENAYKNVLSARARGVTTRALVDENSSRFRALGQALGISVDRFVRTTDEPHRRAVHAFLERLRPEDVYHDNYSGLYCPGCEDFFLEDDLHDGCCPEHRTPVIEVAERNAFFRLSAYQAELRDLIVSRRIRITPEHREREVLQFIDRGLVDISISRDAVRVEGWGIPFPGDAGQVVYVWIDALINYLSGLGFPDSDDVQHFWCSSTSTHFLGKNVWKFHAIYWPALLLSAGLPVPDQIVVHGFLTSEGRKISKSDGGAVDPEEYIGEFGADAVRYFLIRHVHPFEDSDFSIDRLETAYNADLANGIGNLTSRLTALCEDAGVGGSPSPSPISPPSGFEGHVESFRLDLAVAVLWEEVTRLNRELTVSRPWEDLKAGRHAAARKTLAPFAARLGAIGYWLTPVLPSTGEAIRAAVSGSPIRRCLPLFPRRKNGNSSGQTRDK